MSADYKIALISDIHSNFVALKSVMKEIEKEGVDDIVVAGDNIGLFVQPNQTVEFLQKLDAKVIQGNSEDYLRGYDDGTKAHWSNFHQMTPMVWTHGKLTDDNREYLLQLPAQLTFEACGTSFRVVHGSLDKVNELIYKHETGKIRKKIACAKEDIVICGHNHQQYHMKLDGTLIVNPGSAGISFMGNGIAPYSLIVRTNGKWKVEERQAVYNTHEVAAAMKKSDISNYAPWESMLIRSITDGKVATIAFIKFAYRYAKKNGWDGKGDLVPNEYWHSAYKNFDWANYKCARAHLG